MSKLIERMLNIEFDSEFGPVWSESDEALVVKGKLRSSGEIRDAGDELFDKVWFQRHMNLRNRVALGENIDPEVWKSATAAAQRMIETYGGKNLGPYSDFEWGMLNGKLSAIRWVMGSEWDFLDT